MTSHSRSRSGKALTTLSALLLAACGGGGGSDNATGPLVVVPDGPRVVAASTGSDVSGGNLAVLIGPLARAVLGGGSSGLLDPIGGGGTTPQSAVARTGGTGLLRGPTMAGRTALAWLSRVDTAGRKRVAAVSTDSFPCDFGGSLTVTFDDADNDNNLSPGDSIGFSAQNCIDDPGLPAANGGFTMRLNAVELDGQGNPTALDVSGSFDTFLLDGFGAINGSFQLWTRQETVASSRLRIRYDGASVTEADGTVLYDFDIDGLENASGGSYEISGALGIRGQLYALTTPTRVQYAAGQPPAVGQVNLRDAAGDTMQLLARSETRFDIGFLPAGSELLTDLLQDLLWSDYSD